MRARRAYYRLGYPRGDEFMIAQPMGQRWLWCSMAERITAEDPYFTAFWQEPGHLGHDQPELLRDDLVHAEIKRKAGPARRAILSHRPGAEPP